MTTLWDKWAETLPPQQTFGTHLLLTEAMLKNLNGVMAEKVVNTMVVALAKSSLVNGQVPERLDFLSRPEPGLCAIAYAIEVETRCRPTITGYIMCLEETLTTLRRQLRVPWYKLLWARISGKLDIILPWEGK